MKLSANTGFLWPDRAFLQRIQAAFEMGFDAVEFHDEAQGADPDALRDVLARTMLPVLGMNVVMGPQAGCGAIKGHEARAIAEAQTALETAEQIRAGAVHFLAGRTDAPDFAQFARVLRHATAAALIRCRYHLRKFGRNDRHSCHH